MIHSLRANKPQFKSISFRAGFNVVLAERDPAATDRHSRNARGKTSLLSVIDYVLGGNLASNLAPLAEEGWAFTLELDMFGHRVRATRSLASGTVVELTYPTEAAPIFEPYVSQGSVAIDDWKGLLGLANFKLEPSPEATRSAVSVRTLLKYVVRTSVPSSPLKILPTQSGASTRLHVAYMLDLNWGLVERLNDLKAQLEDLKSVSRVVDGHVLEGMIPADEIELERSAAQNNVDAMRRRIGEFRVLEDPQQLVHRADELTSQIAKIRDQAYVDRGMRRLYAEALEPMFNSEPGETADVLSLYEEVGLVFEQSSMRRIEQVAAFRDNLLRNRTELLNLEIDTIDRRLGEAEAQLDALDRQRENLMRALKSGGALDELLALQNELAELESRVNLAEQRLHQAREIGQAQSRLKVEQATLRSDASTALEEDRAKTDRVSDSFRAKMKALYDADAAIHVKVDDEGYHFSTKVSGGASTAVSHMQLFSFDLALLEEGMGTGHHPDFLIHDSIVFDGVDPRQRASALKFANDVATSIGAQYICTINSNDVPSKVSSDNWFSGAVVRTVLDTDEGGLFGIVF